MLQKEWCIAKPSAEYVERMEDVLEVYTLPYNEKRPVVCLDETNRQLVDEITPPRPAREGQPVLYDYEYIRNGVANLFMMFEPLACKRQVKASERRTREDFACCLRELSDEHYPAAEKKILVMDNLNTHTFASLYATYPPEEAWRLCERFEIHYTPKHGSWLNMAEMEIGVVSRQCLGRRIGNIVKMGSEVRSWVTQRNAEKTTVHWQFTTADACVKLVHLYPRF